MTRKIFGIGFQKTGTSSLNRALALLGFNAAGGIRINHPKGVAIEPPLTKEKILPIALAQAVEADAFSDNPWPLLIRELDTEFPGAKFILTQRDPDRWLASMVRHFGDTPNDVTQWIYGVPFPKGNEVRCLHVYMGDTTMPSGGTSLGGPVIFWKWISNAAMAGWNCARFWTNPCLRCAFRTTTRAMSVSANTQAYGGA